MCTPLPQNFVLQYVFLNKVFSCSAFKVNQQPATYMRHIEKKEVLFFFVSGTYIVYIIGSWSFRLFQEQFVTEPRVESIHYYMYMNKEVN